VSALGGRKENGLALIELNQSTRIQGFSGKGRSSPSPRIGVRVGRLKPVDSVDSGAPSSAIVSFPSGVTASVPWDVATTGTAAGLGSTCGSRHDSINDMKPQRDVVGLVVAVMLAIACGGEVSGASSEQPGSAGTGAGGIGAAAGGTGAAALGSGGANASNAGSSSAPLGPDDALVPISADDLNALRANACAGTRAECEPAPLLLQLTIDLSSGMARLVPGTTKTNWEVVSEGLLAMIDALPAMDSVGITFYPNRSGLADVAGPSPASACIDSSRDVPMATLDAIGSAQRSALEQAILGDRKSVV
jgi:hypothetical protein